ncbi:MAG: hypothetical protein ACTIJJ_07825 [Galactobacter sp.]|uniref:hypothetical protein n=1 Tax=Galactobacter sp. TaxID=2676125 RepID=UPI0025C3B18E|nr:hypothetical protein [Galactobacter sp.]
MAVNVRAEWVGETGDTVTYWRPDVDPDRKIVIDKRSGSVLQGQDQVTHLDLAIAATAVRRFRETGEWPRGVVRQS